MRKIFYIFILSLFSLLSYSQDNSGGVFLSYEKMEAVTQDILDENPNISTVRRYGIKGEYMVYIYENTDGKFEDALLFVVNDFSSKVRGYINYFNLGSYKENHSHDKLTSLRIAYHLDRKIIKEDIDPNNKYFHFYMDDESKITFDFDYEDNLAGDHYWIDYQFEDSEGGYKVNMTKLEYCKH
jgi:hypothetical protein